MLPVEVFKASDRYYTIRTNTDKIITVRKDIIQNGKIIRKTPRPFVLRTKTDPI